MATDWARILSDAISGGVQGYKWGDQMHQDALKRKQDEEDRAEAKRRQAEADRRTAELHPLQVRSAQLGAARDEAALIDDGAVVSDVNPGQRNREVIQGLEKILGAGKPVEGVEQTPWRTDPTNYTDIGGGFWQSRADTRTGRAERTEARAEAEKAAQRASFSEALSGTAGLSDDQRQTVQSMYESGQEAAAARMLEYYRDFKQDQEDRDFNRAYMGSNMAATRANLERNRAEDAQRAVAGAAAQLSQRGLPVTDATIRAVLAGPQYQALFGSDGDGRTDRTALAISEFRARTQPEAPASRSGSEPVDTASMMDFARQSHENLAALKRMNLSEAEIQAYTEQIEEQFRSRFGTDLPDEKSLRRPSPRE